MGKKGKLAEMIGSLGIDGKKMLAAVGLAE